MKVQFTCKLKYMEEKAPSMLEKLSKSRKILSISIVSDAEPSHNLRRFLPVGSHNREFPSIVCKQTLFRKE